MDQNMDGHYGDYPNSHSSTSSWSYDNPAPPPPLPLHDGSNFNPGNGFSNGGHYNHHRRFHHHQHQQQNFGTQPNNSVGHVNDNVSNNSLSFAGRKRQFSHGTLPEHIDGGSFVKLYVRGIPREVTEHDVRSVFGEYGNILEVVRFREKRNLQQRQECCFVKYTKIEEADQAIRALHGQYTFPTGVHPVEVKYASGEQERLGGLWTQQCKVYVSCLNKHASKAEIAEIFSPYGCVQEVFLLRDEHRQNRGMGFISFAHRDMAAAAVNALNGKYVMKGCEEPLIVRFAEPKKPKTAEPRPAPLPPNASYTSSQTGSEPPSVSSTSVAPASTEMAEPPDCDWSEHICPDGHSYYYNCVTCESRWEKPEEYSFFEQQLENWHQRPNPLPQLSHSHGHSTQRVSQVQPVQIQT